MNTSTINSTLVTVCELPGNTTNCPFYRINGSAFNCLSSCSGSYPLITSTGNLTCVSSCAVNMYAVISSMNQCIANCSFPFVNTSTTLGSPAAILCALCPLFVKRSNGVCISTCGYVNSSIYNSSTTTICEIPEDA